MQSSPAAADRVLDVGPGDQGVAAEVYQLRVQNGKSQDKAGGGVRVGGEAALTLSQVRVSNNASGLATGGGIDNENQLWLIGCVVDNNTASSGAGLYNNYLATVNNTQFLNNTASRQGGGIYNNFPLTMTNSLVQANKSTGEGGGIYDNDNAQFTAVSVKDNNSNGFDGGGVYVEQEYVLSWHGGSVSGNKGGNGAGIYNGQSLSLTGVSITGNTASGVGGGIYDSDNNVVLTSSQVDSNKSSGDGGGIYVASGGYATVVMDGGSLRSNIADSDSTGDGNGGGLYTDNYVAIRQVTISGNTAVNGGGVYADGASVLTLNESTLNNNKAKSGDGGALFNAFAAHLTNDTITANVALTASGDGGGIYSNGNVRLGLTEVTLNANTAGGTGGGLVSSGHGSVRSSIVSANTAAGSPNNCLNTGPRLSAGYNIDSGHTCGFAFVGDRTNTSPLLGALANNGGPTQTEALLAGSPAKNTAGSACPTSTDQRGSARPRGGACDKGAFEVAS